jgi:hypothetical protein
MAYGAEPAGAAALAHTIYVRPSRQLIAQSWHWPASWHLAFEYATAELVLAAATYVLYGLPLSGARIAAQLSIECVKFRVTRKGTSVYIAVLEFTGPRTGPDAPGPDGGCQQPRAADGLAVGLRGSGRTFQLVVFHGYMPAVPVPVQNARLLSLFERAMHNKCDNYETTHANIVHSDDILQFPAQYLLVTALGSAATNQIGLRIALNAGRIAHYRSPSAGQNLTVGAVQGPYPPPQLFGHPGLPLDDGQAFSCPCISTQTECPPRAVSGPLADVGHDKRQLLPGSGSAFLLASLAIANTNTALQSFARSISTLD